MGMQLNERDERGWKEGRRPRGRRPLRGDELELRVHRRVVLVSIESGERRRRRLCKRYEMRCLL